MKSRNSLWTAWFAAGGIGLLILDSKTALLGATDGLELCIRTVIPSLFPFFVLSILLTGTLTGRSLPFLRPVSRLCGVPEGGEALLAVGLLGGYPVGAQCVYKAHHMGQLSRQEAHRLLGFCSNAGPSFIFGMSAFLFSSPGRVWALWGIHILSALLVGVLLPGKSHGRLMLGSEEPITLPQALQQSIKVMGGVCGWIIAFRVVIAVCDRWFLWLLPEVMRTVLIGVLELANGCFVLRNIESECIRFLLCAAMLAFGGVCVGMQTVSVTGELGTGMYFPGKVMQCILSLMLALLAQLFLFPAAERILEPSAVIAILLLFSIIIAIIIGLRKKTVDFHNPIMYNEGKS